MGESGWATMRQQQSEMEREWERNEWWSDEAKSAVERENVVFHATRPYVRTKNSSVKNLIWLKCKKYNKNNCNNDRYIDIEFYLKFVETNKKANKTVHAGEGTER